MPLFDQVPLSLEGFLHGLGAVVCLGAAWRAGADRFLPVAAGALLGWGAIPLVVLLTREVRPREGHRGGTGLTAEESEGDGPEDLWDPFRIQYFRVRQELILLAVLNLAIVPAELLTIAGIWGYGLTWLSALWVWLTQTRVGAAFWWVWSGSWPLAVGLLLQAGYGIPFLGSSWKWADQVWLQAECCLPGEVYFRQNGVTHELCEAHENWEKAVARVRRLTGLSLGLWLLLLLGIFGAFSRLQF